jgi:pimeloyl-ACP methyl ester carboxylesterase
VEVNGVRLYVEEHGSGVPILCIHGAGSSALVWEDAVARLAGLGLVIAYDRRGCTRSERPEPYETTSVAEHADDAAALLDALEAAPAVVIGRSYGGSVGLELAARYPDRVRAVAALEADAPPELAPETAAWLNGLALDEVPDERVAEVLLREILGAWEELPAELRELLTDNGPAIRAELGGRWWPTADLSGVEQPTLLVVAEDSRPELRAPSEALAGVLPNARIERVAGGHLIDPAGPQVMAFVEDVLRA